MRLSKDVFKKRIVHKLQEETNSDTGNDSILIEENNEPSKYIEIATSVLNKTKYFASKGYSKSKVALKNAVGDVLGTNLFDKYEPNNSKVKPLAILSGSGYLYFRKFILILTLLCPAMIFLYPQIYAAFVVEYLVEASISLPPAKRKNEKDIPLSHRQKRKMLETKTTTEKSKICKIKNKMQNFKKNLKQEDKPKMDTNLDANQPSFEKVLC